MIATLFKIIGVIMGMKVWMIVAIILGGIIGISLLRNVLTGSFSLVKFAGGFNVFSGGVQGKLIYYGVLLILAFGLYHQLTRATFNYDTDYRNNVNNNRDVYLDQRVGETCSEKCAVAIQPFGFTLFKFACVKSCQASITQQTKVDEVKTIEKKEEVKKEESKTVPENKKYKKK